MKLKNTITSPTEIIDYVLQSYWNIILVDVYLIILNFLVVASFGNWTQPIPWHLKLECPAYIKLRFATVYVWKGLIEWYLLQVIVQFQYIPVVKELDKYTVQEKFLIFSFSLILIWKTYFIENWLSPGCPASCLGCTCV